MTGRSRNATNALTIWEEEMQMQLFYCLFLGGIRHNVAVHQQCMSVNIVCLEHVLRQLQWHNSEPRWDTTSRVTWLRVAKLSSPEIDAFSVVIAQNSSEPDSCQSCWTRHFLQRRLVEAQKWGRHEECGWREQSASRCKNIAVFTALCTFLLQTKNNTKSKTSHLAIRAEKNHLETERGYCKQCHFWCSYHKKTCSCC